MSYLSDCQIKQAVAEYGLIEPFIDHLIERDKDGNGLISYGLSSYGYDVRIGNRIKMLNPTKKCEIIDPKNFNEELMIEIIITDGTYFLIPPRQSVLLESVEKFRFARNMTGYIALCSTYARCHILAGTAAIEPEWGTKDEPCKLTIEITNPTFLPVKIYIGEGIVQIQFQENHEECEVSYADRKGKYSSHHGLTPVVRGHYVVT